MHMGYMLKPHQDFSPRGSPIKDTVTDKEMETLRDVVPTRPNGREHPCFKHKDPVYACGCYFKIGHAGPGAGFN